MLYDRCDLLLPCLPQWSLTEQDHSCLLLSF